MTIGSLPQRQSAAYRVVREAIVNKQIVVANYRGHRREMCPHVIGYKNGREHALLYQFAGGSSSGLSADPAKNWRCVFVDELTDITVRDGAWRSGPNHSRPQSCVDHIDVEVAY